MSTIQHVTIGGQPFTRTEEGEGVVFTEGHEGMTTTSKQEHMLDLDRREHMDSIREALLFCCLDKRPVEKRISDAIEALRTCARWFPKETT